MARWTRGWVVRNQTPCRLVLHGDGGRGLELAPLQTRTLDVPPPELGAAVQQAVDDGALAWEPQPTREVRERWAGLAVLLGAGAGLWLALAVWQRAWLPAALALTGVLASLAALVVLDRLSRCDGRWSWRRGDAERGFNSWASARRVVQRALHTLLLLLVLAVGLAVPAAAVWWGTGLSAVPAQVRRDGVDEVGQVLVAHGLQVALVAVLVLMPALMYFWFDRERVETLLDRWLHHIFRFDPSLRTLADVDAKHGRRLEEAYGTVASGVLVRSQHRARSRAPVVLATLLLALGWMLVLVNAGAVERDEEAFARFEVTRNAVSFAFLGAYVYALQVVLRGYVRGDLRPKTYNAISVRIVLAFVLAAVLEGVLPPEGVGETVALSTAFLAGIVPDTVLRRLRDAAGWWTSRDSADELRDAWPLTEVTGIDLYERTRLGEEGITNVQALAHCDVVALTLSTRIPFERVVHWVDQAVLHEHTSRRERARLRRCGITTATALLDVGELEREELDAALPQLHAPLLLRALGRADWVPMLLAWRRHSALTRPDELVYPRPPAGLRPTEVSTGSSTGGSADSSTGSSTDSSADSSTDSTDSSTDSAAPALAALPRPARAPRRSPAPR